MSDSMHGVAARLGYRAGDRAKDPVWIRVGARMWDRLGTRLWLRVGWSVVDRVMESLP